MANGVSQAEPVRMVEVNAAKTGLAAKLLIAAFSSLFGLLLVAAAGEFAVRQRERTRTDVPGTMPLIYYRHNRLGHALVRNYDYFGWAHINALGFRGRAVSLTKRPGVVRIVVMGGSTTFDNGVRGDNKTWPARTEYWLRKLAPNADVEVINAGIPGYQITEDLVRLQTDIARLRPDVVIELQAHNDLTRALSAARLQPETSARPDEVPAVLPGMRWIERHSLLYAKIRVKVRALRSRRSRPSAPSAAPDWKTALEEGTNRFERELNAFVLTAQMMGVRVVLAEAAHVSGPGTTVESDPTIARNWAIAIPAPTQIVLSGYAQLNEAIRRTARARSADLLPAAGWGITGPSNYATDDPIHFNDQGADLMGRRTAEALLQAGILSGRR